MSVHVGVGVHVQPFVCPCICVCANACVCLSRRVNSEIACVCPFVCIKVIMGVCLCAFQVCVRVSLLGRSKLETGTAAEGSCYSLLPQFTEGPALH